MTDCNILIPNFQPDPFFTAEQQQRLSTLMDAWREACDREETFPTALKVELDELVEAELIASADRWRFLFRESVLTVEEQ
jgi:hypothetical protein